jgi:hypothetical protein
MALGGEPSFVKVTVGAAIAGAINAEKNTPPTIFKTIRCNDNLEHIVLTPAGWKTPSANFDTGR